MDEEMPAMGVPEWVVTFGDMMSLLLTFFIMLVSMSEIKDQKKYQAVAEAMKKQLGYDRSMASLIPGRLKPRDSASLRKRADDRSDRKDLFKTGEKTKAPLGEFPKVQIIREGNRSAIGTVVFFEEFETDLSEKFREALHDMELELGGKMTKIEVRGHTTMRPVADNDKLRDNWDLAYERCRKTMKFLVDELKIDPRRIRMSVAGPHEPMHVGANPILLQTNSRVEVFLLDETVDDRQGTVKERDQNYISEPT